MSRDTYIDTYIITSILVRLHIITVSITSLCRRNVLQQDGLSD